MIFKNIILPRFYSRCISWFRGSKTVDIVCNAYCRYISNNIVASYLIKSALIFFIKCALIFFINFPYIWIFIHRPLHQKSSRQCVRHFVIMVISHPLTSRVVNDCLTIPGEACICLVSYFTVWFNKCRKVNVKQLWCLNLINSSNFFLCGYTVNGLKENTV